jgi:hypothetical protein
VLESRPLAYWRLEELEGPTAADATAQGHRARIEGGTAFYLEGPPGPGFAGGTTLNRAVHLAGGHLDLGLPSPGMFSSVELWFWNGLPSTIRPVTGTLFSRTLGDRLTIGGGVMAPGRLALGESTGKTEILPRTWHHVVFVRSNEDIAVYLDGSIEIQGHMPLLPQFAGQLLIGGSVDVDASFEGKIDEVAVYDRGLTADEVAAHYRAASSGP